MTLSDIQSKIYELTGTDANSYLNANMLINLNMWLHKVVSMVFDSEDEVDYDDPNRTDYPIITQTLTTSRDYTIPFSKDILKIKNVAVSYDGTNYYKAFPLDDGEVDLPVLPAGAASANTNLDSYYTRTNPRYDLKFNSIWLYPVATASDVASNGKILIEYEREPQDFTSGDLTTGTLVPGIIKTFQPMLAYGAALEYALPKNLPQLKSIISTLTDLEIRLRKQYNSQQKDRRLMMGADYQYMK